MDRLRNKIRDIPDFPKPGIIFKDITPLVKDPATLRLAVHQLLFPFLGKDITAVAGMEARGFIFGSLVAWELGLPFIPLRKPRLAPCQSVGDRSGGMWRGTAGPAPSWSVTEFVS